MSNKIKMTKKLKKLIMIIYFTIMFFFLLNCILVRFFIINFTESSPIGIYLKQNSKNIELNDYVVYTIPEDYRKYGKYSSDFEKTIINNKTIKKIVAKKGDVIDVINGVIYINKEFIAIINANIPSKLESKILGDEEYLTLSYNENSLDGKYYGYIKKDQIIYKAKLIYKMDF